MLIEFIDELKILMEKHKCYFTGSLKIRTNDDFNSYSCEYSNKINYNNGTTENGDFIICVVEEKKPVPQMVSNQASFHISSDISGYTCPVTNNWIEGRAAHRENLKRQGCRVLEPGEREQYVKEKPKEIERNAEKVANFFAERMASQL